MALTFQALGSGDMESGRKEEAPSSVPFPLVLEGGPSQKRVHKQHLMKQEYWFGHSVTLNQLRVLELGKAGWDSV